MKENKKGLLKLILKSDTNPTTFKEISNCGLVKGFFFSFFFHSFSFFKYILAIRKDEYRPKQ